MTRGDSSVSLVEKRAADEQDERRGEREGANARRQDSAARTRPGRAGERRTAWCAGVRRAVAAWSRPRRAARILLEATRTRLAECSTGCRACISRGPTRSAATREWHGGHAREVLVDAASVRRRQLVVDIRA